MVKSFKNNYKNIIIFLIPFITCCFFLYVYYPGIYNFDVYTQLSQIKNNSFDTAHPFISTFYLLIFQKVFRFKSAVVIFQILYFCVLWMLICKLNRKDDSKKNFILQLLITIFISVNPLMNTVIICTNKDTLFMLIFMTICYLLQKILSRRFDCKNYLYILLSFFLVFFQNVRHNGLYANIIFIPIFIILICITLKKEGLKKLIIFICSFVFFFIMFKVPLKIYNVQKFNVSIETQGTLKALQLEGYLYNNHILSQSEIDILEKYVSVKSLSENSWNYTFQDYMALVEKKDYYYGHEKEFIKESLKIAMNHKFSSLLFYHTSSTIVWDIVMDESSIHNYLWLWNDMPNKLIGYDFVNKDTKLFNFIDTKLTKSMKNKLVIALFYSPATYLYLSLILTIYLIIKKKKMIWIITLYNLINVAIISVSIPMQDTRYLLNNFVLVYVLMCISSYYFLSKKPCVENNNIKAIC